VVAADGDVWPFGNATSYPTPVGIPLPVTSIAGSPTGLGYDLLSSDGAVTPVGPNPPGGSTPVAPPQPTPPAGPPVASPGGPPTTGPYAFLFTPINGAPVRWNPCLPLRYEVNFAGAQASARSDLSGAIAQVAAATGINFQQVRETTGTTADPDVDALIAWESPAQQPEFTGGAIGLGGASYYTAGPVNDPQLVHGVVEIDSAFAFTAGFGGPNSLGTVLLHELGHMVGLGHVADPTQVMYPIASTRSDYGPGDLEGLWYVGTPQGCLRTPHGMRPGA